MTMASATIIELDETNICKLCNNALGKYTCPRCDCLYCSLTCYQSDAHLQCSESFYHDCVSQQLSVDGAESRAAKMLEVLQRAHDENVKVGGEVPLDSDDEDEHLDLGERLARVDLNDPEMVWERLNSDERQEFEAFLRSDDVSKFIRRWEPWWSRHIDKTVVDVDELEKHKKTCPKILDNIKSLELISKTTPSDRVRYDVINVLGAYVFAMRYFNGEPLDFTKEAVACVVALSQTLKNNHNFDGFETAIESVHQECLDTAWIQTDEENIQLMRQDVHGVLKGPHATDKKFYVMCAMSDLLRLFEASLLDDGTKPDGGFSKAFPESQFPQVQLEPKRKVRKYIKKLEYFLSFVKSHFEY